MVIKDKVYNFKYKEKDYTYSAFNISDLLRVSVFDKNKRFIGNLNLDKKSGECLVRVSDVEPSVFSIPHDLECFKKRSLKSVAILICKFNKC